MVLRLADVDMRVCDAEHLRVHDMCHIHMSDACHVHVMC